MCLTAGEWMTLYNECLTIAISYLFPFNFLLTGKITFEKKKVIIIIRKYIFIFTREVVSAIKM
jgi:hypothetical protein